MDHKLNYYEQDLSQLWSFDAYGRYGEAKWEWVHFPFDDDFSKPNRSFRYTVEKPVKKCSIVEIGPAMGAGYYALNQKGTIDTSDYTGIEISEKGFAEAKKNFPNANWIHADFTKYEFTRRFDYGYERHALHHMPSPVEQVRKILKHINICFIMTFRGCIQEGTISDLEKCHHRNGGYGLVYLDIISVPEIVKVALDQGFNNIRILYWGKQEDISSEPGSDPFMASELIGKKDYALYTVRFARSLEIKEPLIYSVMAGKFGGLIKWFKTPAEVIRLRNGVKQLHSSVFI